MEKLPKKYRGADVERGRGMKERDLDALLERKAMDCFDANLDTWIVVADAALEDLDASVQMKAFNSKKDAIDVARALACGNRDQRVLRVTEQTLVVATEHDL